MEGNYPFRSPDELSKFTKALENIRKFSQTTDGVWVPLFYRAFGFPCNIDVGPGGDERIDLTWMTEDVALIANFLEQRRAIRGKNRHDLSRERQNLQPGNKHFPASVVFDTYEEIEELITPPIRYRSIINVDRIAPYQYDLECSSMLLDGNGVMFIYLTGHGLSKDLAKKFSNEDVDLKQLIPEYNKYPVAENGSGRLQPDEELEGGELLAYITLLGIKNFIEEFIEVCRNNTWEFQHQPFFVKEKPFTHRHLIILVDACFAGHWITSFETDRFQPFVEGTNVSINIQTATDNNSCSYGYFFTPLFVKLQHLSQKQLDALVQKFLNQPDKQCYVNEIQQFPQFCFAKTDLDTTDGKVYLKSHDDDWKNALYFTVHNLRFFVNKEFFAYFADTYKYEFLAADSIEVPRPVLNNEEGRQFLNMLISKKMIIRGMKLTRYDRDKTPLCIAVIRSKNNNFINTDNVLSSYDEYWYHLHIHYDGNDEYPGAITCIKLIYAKQDQLKSYEKGTYTDASIKDEDDYEAVLRRQGVEAVGNWRQYRPQLEKRLKSWAESQKDGLKKWKNKDQWSKFNPARLGDVAVRERSRHLITKEINLRNLKTEICKRACLIGEDSSCDIPCEKKSI